MKSLCKFCIILRFLLANKSIFTIELKLSRKVHDAFFASRIPDTLLHFYLVAQLNCHQTQRLHHNDTITAAVCITVLLKL